MGEQSRRWRQGGTLGAVLILHGLLLFALTLVRSQLPTGATGVVAVFTMAAPSPPQSRVVSTEPAPGRVTMPPVATPSQGDRCEPVDALGSALAANPAVRSAVEALPPTSMTETGVSAIWNDGWSALADTPEAPLAALRAIVEPVLAALPAACLDKPVIGPRLILVPANGGMAAIVFGSGTWRWADLLSGSEVLQP